MYKAYFTKAHLVLTLQGAPWRTREKNLGGIHFMIPTKVTWLCDECGEEYSRDVVEVITDDGAQVSVKVELFEGEEAPLCPCLSDDAEVPAGE